ncbi:D-amino acid aminotransferase [Candidatus Thioglobus sp.]|jgi:Branched-chain amino acid aminotransferase/4-amino-4-deoxychorismate lyase|uniref:D-amino acid aminotransferase n=1 Tax=Candidatus Thioglobus sp. TaxID=2026721 RepID=UPI003242135B
MVYLNGDFIAKDKASISVMDRGFLFGDGVYEVIPAYNGKIFRPTEHLDRLQKSLDSIQITNPYSHNKWINILNKLVNHSSNTNQSLYLQITRGTDTKRKHNFDALTPTIYVESNPLTSKTKQELSKGFSAISAQDIRWSRCDIKATSLLANVLYAQDAKKHNVEEVILYRDNQITEGATSNVFILKNNILYTHPTGANILSGITRDLVLESASACSIQIQESSFSLDNIFTSDELWISSSTREIMPITKLDNKPINQGKVGAIWGCVFEYYQRLKND